MSAFATETDAEGGMTLLVLSGADIAFTTSFGYSDPVTTIPARVPNAKFEHAVGYERRPLHASRDSAWF